MTSSVKYYHSELPGAPILSGTAGSLIAVLDACLVNGWGLLTATSVIVTSEVATALFPSGHAFEPLSTVLVDGAATPDINGEKRVTSTATNSIIFPAPGVADGPVSGTITVKLAPAGWQKLAGTNKAAYKSASPSASGCWARIDDSSAKIARLRAFETMTDVDTGVGPTPTDGQITGGLYVAKSEVANTTARKWIVVASDRSVVLLTAYYSGYVNDYNPCFFGDFPSLKAGDAYNFMAVADTADPTGSQYVGYNALSSSASATGVYIVRSYTQAGGSSTATLRKPGLMTGGSGDNSNPPGPNPINNSLDVIPTLVYEGTGNSAPRRGWIPGIYGIPHALGSSYDSKQQIAAVADLPGHVLIGVRYYSVSSGSRYAVDITGPWG